MGRTLKFDLVTNWKPYVSGLQRAVDGNKKLSSSFEEMSKTTDKLRGDFSGAESKISRLDKTVRTAARGATSGESNFTKLRHAVAAAATPARVLGEMWKLIKWPAIAAGINVGTVALGALTAGALQVTGALIPLAGALPALGVGMLAVKQATLVGKLAFMGIGPAMKAAGVNAALFKKQMDKLPPAQRAIVRELLPFKKEYLAFQKIAAQAIMPGLVAGLHNALPAFRGLRPVIRATGTALGDLARAGGRLVSTGPFRREFVSLGLNNVKIIRTLGQAALALAPAILHIATAAQPLAIWMAHLARTWARLITEFIRGERQTGGLITFFNLTKATIITLIGTVGHFAHALGPIFSAGIPGGQSFLKMLRDGAVMFDRWTHSSRGVAAVTKLFADSRPILAALGRFVLELVKDFVHLNDEVTATGFAAMIDKVAATAVPAFAAMARSASAHFIDNLVRIGTALISILGTLAGDSGTLTGFTGTMAILGETLNKLIENVPGFGKLVIAITTLVGIGKATGLSALIGGFNSLYVSQALLASTGKKTLTTIIATWVWEKAVAVSTKVWAIANRILAISMLGIPLVAIIVGIAALVAGIILAYKHSETFRKIVQATFHAVLAAAQAAWNWIKKNWPYLLAILGGPITLAAVAIIRNWQRVQAVFKTVWNAIRNGIATAVVAIINIFRNMFNAAFNTAMSILHVMGKLPGPLGAPFRAGEKAIRGMRDTANREMDRIQAKVNSLRPPPPLKATVTGTVKWDKNAELLKQVTGNFAHKAPVFAEGGKIPGYGGGDRVPIMAEKGEAVVDKRRTRAYAPLLAAMGVPGFAAGGLIGGRLLLKLPRVTNITDANAMATALFGSSRLRGADALSVLGGAGTAAGFPGGPASGNVVRIALGVAKRMHAIFKVALSLIEAGIVESGLRNLPYGDRDSLGFLQQRPSQGWAHPMNIAYASWDFLRRAIPIASRYGTAGALAQAVQRSAFPGRYDAVQAQALRILGAYGYANGAWKVPRNQLAMVHTGEMIVPRGRAEAIRRGGGGAVVIQTGAVQVSFTGTVDAATLPQVQGMLDSAFSDFTDLLAIKLGRVRR
jgi:hypothetical protein